MTVSRPARRWKARILLPAVILGTIAALLGYTARNALLPVTGVWVAPVVAAPRTGANLDSLHAEIPANQPAGERGAMLVQAPGWIEPAPYAVNVPALTEGVISEVLVLEGESVAKGQVVARLVDEDARLGVQAAEAQLGAFKADLTKTRAEVHVARSRVAEIQDQLGRARKLVETGGGSEGERAQLAIRLHAAEQTVNVLEAAVAFAEADVRRQEIALAQAQLTLSRTQIVAPAGGVVMTLLVGPGSRISMGGRAAGAGSDSMNGTIVRLYDPKKLQVRVDVPLADFAKLGIGSPAEVATEALADKTFQGKLTRIVHEANIQRNTVPVKVSIEHPDELLKPEMLARVRFYGMRDQVGASTAKGERVGGADNTGGVRLLVLEAALQGRREEAARAWLVVHDVRAGAMVATARDVRITRSNVPGFAEVLDGLQAGDRVILDPPGTLKNGDRVRILGEQQNTPSNGSENRP